MAIVTVVLVVLLASHPELRLLVPFIDAVGIDLFAMVIGAHLWSYIRLGLLKVYRQFLLPVAQRLYTRLYTYLALQDPMPMKPSALASPVASWSLRIHPNRMIFASRLNSDI